MVHSTNSLQVAIILSNTDSKKNRGFLTINTIVKKLEKWSHKWIEIANLLDVPSTVSQYNYCSHISSILYW